MPCQNWKACNIFDGGDDGIQVLQDVATKRARHEVAKFPWLRRHMGLEDVSQTLLQSAVRVAQLHPDTEWDDYVKLCQKSFSNTLLNLRTRHKDEYFGYLVAEVDLAEGEFERRMPPARELVLTGSEAKRLRDKFVEDLRSRMESRLRPDRYALIVKALTTAGASFQDALASLGVGEKELSGAVRSLKECAEAVAPELDLDDVYYLWCDAR